MTDDDPQPPALDQLYAELAKAHTMEDGLEQQRQQLREHVTRSETQLQQARTVAEAAGDTAQVKRIDSELEELRRAWSTLTDDEDTGAQDQQQDVDRGRDARDRDRHHGGPRA